MIAPYELLPHAESFGFDKNRWYASYRALNQDGQMNFSHGRGFKREKIEEEHVARLILADCINCTVANVPKNVRSYYYCRDDEGNAVGDVIARYLRALRRAPHDFANRNATPELAVAALAYKSCIIVDCDFPSVTIVNETTDGPLETIYGPIRDKPSSAVRAVKSVTISGKLLFDIAQVINTYGDKD